MNFSSMLLGTVLVSAFYTLYDTRANLVGKMLEMCRRVESREAHLAVGWSLARDLGGGTDSA